MNDARKDQSAASATCQRCGAPYALRKPWQKYCGPACRRGTHQTLRNDGLPVTIGRLSTRKSGCLSLSVIIERADGERAIKMFGAQGARARLAPGPADDDR